jgi:hypothetical protein
MTIGAVGKDDVISENPVVPAGWIATSILPRADLVLDESESLNEERERGFNHLHRDVSAIGNRREPVWTITGRAAPEASEKQLVIHKGSASFRVVATEREIERLRTRSYDSSGSCLSESLNDYLKDPVI